MRSNDSNGSRAARARSFTGLWTVLVMGLVASVTVARPAEAHRAYVANSDSKDVSVIDRDTNKVVGEPIKVVLAPNGVAVNPDGKKAQCHRIIRVRWACCYQNGRCIRLCHEFRRQTTFRRSTRRPTRSW